MNRREVTYASELFRGLNFQPHTLVEDVLYIVLQGLFSSTSSNGGHIIYKGSIDLRSSCIYNPTNHFDTILRCFIFYSEQYRRLGPEENYVGDRGTHHRFLRVLVTTAACAYWLKFPASFDYNTPFDCSIDLTTLPAWATKVIKKVSITHNYSILFDYFSYEQISEE